MNLSIKYTVAMAVLFSMMYCNKLDNTFIEDGATVDKDSELIKFLTEQNSWIYEQMIDQYYWADDIPSQKTLDFTVESTIFFENIRSSSDRFSWVATNDSYVGDILSNKFGIEHQGYTLDNGEIIYRVLYVVDGSSSQASGLRRGMWFKVNSELNYETTSLSLIVGQVESNYFTATNTISIIPSDITRATSLNYSISLDSIYYIADKKIGYFVYNSFDDTTGEINNPYRTELRNLFDEFNGVGLDDLIIDLRYNPGGYLSICKYLCGLILPDEHLGAMSGYHTFNSNLSKIYHDTTGSEFEYQYFPTKDDIFSKNIGMNRLYVILTEKSYSASESLVNSLKPYIDVVVVGNNSGGKGVGSWTIKDDRYKYLIQPITFRYFNIDGQTVLDEGITPDIIAQESTQTEIYDLGDIRELLLSKTLEDILGEEQSATQNTVSTKLSLQPVYNTNSNKKALYSSNPLNN